MAIGALRLIGSDWLRAARVMVGLRGKLWTSSDRTQQSHDAIHFRTSKKLMVLY